MKKNPKFKKNDLVIANFYADDFWYVGRITQVGCYDTNGNFEKLSESNKLNEEVNFVYIVNFFGKTPNELLEKHIRTFEDVMFEGANVEYSSAKGDTSYDCLGKISSIDTNQNICVVTNRFNKNASEVVDFEDIRITYRKLEK